MNNITLINEDIDYLLILLIKFIFFQYIKTFTICIKIKILKY